MRSASIANENFPNKSASGLQIVHTLATLATEGAGAGD
jgi:hypothetical protein